MEEVHRENTSILKYNDENALACVLSLAFYTARNRYEMVRELPSGKGFADIVLVPYKHVDAPAVVLELKWNKKADSAIEQIKRQEYAGRLLHFAGDVILVGINYDKRSKKHSCVIERLSEPITNSTITDNKPTTTDNKPVTTHQKTVLRLVEDGERSIKELMDGCGYKDRDSFRKSVLNELIDRKMVAMTHPENPNHRGQRYVKVEG